MQMCGQSYLTKGRPHFVTRGYFIINTHTVDGVNTWTSRGYVRRISPFLPPQYLLPLSSLMYQMGSDPKAAIFADDVLDGLRRWRHRHHLTHGAPPDTSLKWMGKAKKGKSSQGGEEGPLKSA